MTDCDLCQNFTIIRKQREELVLLTNELNCQEEQIKELHSENIDLKELIKKKEKKETELEKKIKSLNSEISNLNDNLKQKTNELESIKQKISHKDSYIQSQSNRILQLQTKNEKSSAEINTFIKNKSEIKSEIMKFQAKIKEQYNRILDLKQQNTEIIKILESRNSLIKSSSEHIRVLEHNLLEFLAYLKTNQEKIKIPNEEMSFQKQISSKNKLETINEEKLISVLKDLKETWLENNLKYEEVKNLVVNNLKDTTTINSVSKTNDFTINNLDEINRILTSSPILQ